MRVPAYIPLQKNGQFIKQKVPTKYTEKVLKVPDVAYVQLNRLQQIVWAKLRVGNN